jgi:hypothetical protein
VGGHTEEIDVPSERMLRQMAEIEAVLRPYGGQPLTAGQIANLAWPGAAGWQASPALRQLVAAGQAEKYDSIPPTYTATRPAAPERRTLAEVFFEQDADAVDEAQPVPPRPRRTPSHMLVWHTCPCCGRRIRGCVYYRHERRCHQVDLEQLIAVAVQPEAVA